MIKVNYQDELVLPADTAKHKFQSLPVFKELFERNVYKMDIIEQQLGSVEDLVVWDVGSHIGLFSFMCKSLIPSSNIHTFENIPIRVQEQQKILERFSNIKINNVKLLGFANDVAKCRSYISRLDEDDINLYLRPIKNVSAISVNQYILEGNPPPSLLKIDMEGGEVGVMEEMR